MQQFEENFYTCAAVLLGILYVWHMAKGWSYLEFIGSFPVILTINDISKINFSKAVYWKLLKIRINAPHNIFFLNVSLQLSTA